MGNRGIIEGPERKPFPILCEWSLCEWYSMDSNLQGSGIYLWVLNVIKTLPFSVFFIQVQLSPFSPHHTHHAPPSLFPTFKPIPFGFVHMSFIHVPWWSFPYYPSLHSFLVTVSLFLISMSLVIFCLLVCFVHWVPVKGEIIRYLSLTTWLFHLA